MGKKKILIIPSWYPNKDKPWLGTFFQEQANLMTDLFDIKVFIGKQKSTNRAQRILNTILYILTGKVKLRSLEKYYMEPPQVFGFEYLEKINRFKKLNYHYQINAYLKYFEKLITIWNPDLIHAHDTVMGGIISYYIYKKWKIPYMITEHNRFGYFKASHIVADFRSTINNSTKLFVVSQYQKIKQKEKFNNLSINVIGNYVDEKIFFITKTNNPKFIILFIGFYQFFKDYDTLIDTIKYFSALTKNNNFCYQIVGCGDNGAQKINNELSQLIVSKNVEIYPYVSRKNIPEFVKNCSVFLSTSISETFGISMCEAMMCGKPVVSTDNKGFDEMYVPNMNGIKCEVGNARQLAKSLIDIQENKITFDPCKIRDSVLHKFGTKAFKDKLSGIYSEVIEG